MHLNLNADPRSGLASGKVIAGSGLQRRGLWVRTTSKKNTFIAGWQKM